jgi:hypothetical protein
VSLGANLLRQPVGQLSDHLVAEAEPLRCPQEFRVQLFVQQPLLHLHDVLQPLKEPRVDAVALVRHVHHVRTLPERGHHRPESLVRRVKRKLG